MPHSDHSHASYSSAGDSCFRLRTLKHAHIRFETSSASAPESVLKLIALLAHWPWPHPTIDETQPLPTSSLTDDEIGEMLIATDRARQLDTTVITACTFCTEAQWRTDVNCIVLRTLKDPRVPPENPTLTKVQKSVWLEGQDLGLAPGPYNPVPDYSFGLTFDSLTSDEALTESKLFALRTDKDVRLTFCPTECDSYVYPAIIYEGKADTVVIGHAENQVAVSAARALGLLNQLTDLSRVPHSHCVLAIASAGAQWVLYVAFREAESVPSVHLVPVLTRPLFIQDFTDRVRLFYILNRLKRWMLGPYRSKVAEQVGALWRISQGQ